MSEICTELETKNHIVTIDMLEFQFNRKEYARFSKFEITFI